jgi:hypothetical protein
VKRISVKPKVVTGLDGKKYVSLGRWDSDDERTNNSLDLKERKDHIHTTMAGPIT